VVCWCASLALVVCIVWALVCIVGAGADLVALVALILAQVLALVA